MNVAEGVSIAGEEEALPRAEAGAGKGRSGGSQPCDAPSLSLVTVPSVRNAMGVRTREPANAADPGASIWEHFRPSSCSPTPLSFFSVSPPSPRFPFLQIPCPAQA